MRGSPLWQLVLVLVAFAALGVPVWRLTRAASEQPEKLVIQGSPSQLLREPALLQLTVTADFAPTPTELSVSNLGKTILEARGQATATAGWQAQIPTEGADLVLHAVWPQDANGSQGKTAARVRVRWPDGHELDKSFWAKTGETLDEVVTIPGDAKQPQP